MPTLPVYILIDTSGSMRGEPIRAVNDGLADMLAHLRADEKADATVSICIITFDRDVRCVLPLTPLPDIRLPQITTPESGPTHTGQALLLCLDMINRDRAAGIARDFKPLLFLLTDGKPSDALLYDSVAANLRRQQFGNIVACAAGRKADTEPLRRLTENVYRLEGLDEATISKFFFWVSNFTSEALEADEPEDIW